MLLGNHFVETGLAEYYILKQNVEHTAEGGILIYTGDKTIDVIMSLGKLTHGVCDYTLMIDGEYFNPATLMYDKIISLLNNKDSSVENLYDFYMLANRFDFSGKTLKKKLMSVSLSPITELHQIEKLYIKWKQLDLNVLLGKAWLYIPNFSQALTLFNTTVLLCIENDCDYRWEHYLGTRNYFKKQLRFKNPNYDDLIKQISVICNCCALARAGLILFSKVHLDVFNDSKFLSKRTDTGIITYYFNPDIDYEYELTPSETNPLLLLPSKERAIVECIKWIDYVDEGVLIEALKDYLDMFWNDRIYEVGEHFGVSRETLDYWFKEAREDEEV